MRCLSPFSGYGDNVHDTLYASKTMRIMRQYNNTIADVRVFLSSIEIFIESQDSRESKYDS